MACSDLVSEDYKLLLEGNWDMKNTLYNITLDARKSGSLAVLEWARQQDLFAFVDIELLGVHGNSDVLDWAESTNMLTWNFILFITKAAEAGNVDAFKWI